MVEEMLAARGISVTCETIWQWDLKFGREFANRIRRRAPHWGDKSACCMDSSFIFSIICGVSSTFGASKIRNFFVPMLPENDDIDDTSIANLLI
jgi:hypothetical protein